MKWLTIFIFIFVACYKPKLMHHNNQSDITNSSTAIITLGGGCFWCIEAVYLRLNGVQKVVSGYSGGVVENPTYKDICTGTTGHAEVCQIYYDSTVLKLETLLEVFWKVHDPTSLNRQGNDVGTQYRSAIFYHNDYQFDVASKIISDLNHLKVFDKQIVTELKPASIFYPAENYHQDYYANNASQPYCQFVVKPKIDKLEQYFDSLLKK